MVPELASGASLAGASFLEAAIIVFHAVLGTVAVAAGAIIIAAWVTHPLGEMGCNPRWKWMIPTFAVWAAAFVLGVVLVVL
jgi:hypothetical protein